MGVGTITVLNRTNTVNNDSAGNLSVTVGKYFFVFFSQQFIFKSVIKLGDHHGGD